MHSVGIDIFSIIYPRTLVEETTVNGITQPQVVCYHMLDCADKCDYYARKAHSGGLPSPPACALCSPPCPTAAGQLPPPPWFAGHHYRDPPGGFPQPGGVCAGA